MQSPRHEIPESEKDMKKKTPPSINNILLCGVGGQGTLLASNVLAEAAMESGFDVKKSEVHGMAQRGGSVVSHVRFGEKVNSPLIRMGECDLLLSFEFLEALRWASYMKATGKIIVNTQKILPMSVSAGNSKYPENIEETLRKNVSSVFAIDGTGNAEKLGNAKCLNVVLLGILSREVPVIKKEVWKEVLKRRIPQKLLDLNLKAFEVGWNLV